VIILFLFLTVTNDFCADHFFTQAEILTANNITYRTQKKRQEKKDNIK